MKKHYPALRSLSLIAVAVSLTAQLAAQNATIAITEIMYNPPEAGNDSLEYIEIYNYGSAGVNLGGFTFTGIDFVIPTMIEGNPPILPAGEHSVIGINDTALVNTFNLGYATSWTTGALSNNGEGLSIRDAQGNLVDTVYFDDTVAWPVSADGGGASLERCDPTSDGTLPESWIASTTSTGVTVNGIEIFATPSAVNSECVAVGIDDNIISTLTAYPNPSATGRFQLSTNVTGGVYDILGQQVLSLRSTNLIDLSSKREGHYFLRTDEGVVIRLMK
ncbi:MAG: lamin tail domain-containing protein [Flavobacteriales bacterium]|nr:lamin tail domain-containing protein [Flavobacteriales bacterium]